MAIDTNIRHYYTDCTGNMMYYDECNNSYLQNLLERNFENYYATGVRNAKALLQKEIINTQCNSVYSYYADTDEGIIRKELITTPKVKEVKVEEKLVIKKVIFSDPATIVLWSDGTKTVVKTQKGDPYDPEKGLAMACMKKMLSKKDYHKHLEEAQRFFVKQFRADVLDVLEKTQLNPLHVDPSPEFR